jgi:hypothetical protein
VGWRAWLRGNLAVAGSAEAEGSEAVDFEMVAVAAAGSEAGSGVVADSGAAGSGLGGVGL